MTAEVLNPFSAFGGGTGLPLTGAYVYVGAEGDDPQTDPIAVYWDAAHTIPAAQPLRTTGGRIMNGGSPARAYVNANAYSIRVRDLLGAEVFYQASVTDPIYDFVGFPGGSGNVGYKAQGSGAEDSNVERELRRLGITPDSFSGGFAGASLRATNVTVSANGGQRYSWASHQTDAIVVNSGVHTDVATLGGDNLPALFLQARYSGTATLDRSGETDYLYERGAGPIVQANLLGFNIWGGKGVVNHTYIGNNVQGYFVAQDLVAIGYTECAFVFGSDDHPYRFFDRVVLRGEDEAIGIAGNGKYDACVISRSEFHNNRYDLKFVGTRSGSLTIDTCSFFTVRPIPSGEPQTPNPDKKARIWIGPTPTSANSGTATVVRACKFGNEHQTLDAPVVLFADEDEDSGDSLADRGHSTDPSTGFVDGFALIDNRFDGLEGITAPLISSHTSNISRFHATGNWYGAAFTHLIKYMNVEGFEDTFYTRRNYVNLAFGATPGIRPFSEAVSNRWIGRIDDPQGFMQGDPHVMFNGVSEGGSALTIAKGQGNDGLVGGAGVSKAAVAAGFLGVKNAAEVTVASEGDTSKAWYFNLPAVLEANRPTWLDIYLQEGATSSLQEVAVAVYNTASGKFAVQENVRLYGGGAHLSIGPFCFHVENTGDWRLLVWAKGYSSSATKFRVGSFALYHGRSPMVTGDLRTLDDLGWNKAKWRDAGGVVWRDATGAFRHLEGSEPTSDQNGHMLGPQKPNTVSAIIAGGGSAGDIAFATNGRKAGEGVGAGTGCPAYFDGTTWRNYEHGALAA